MRASGHYLDFVLVYGPTDIFFYYRPETYRVHKTMLCLPAFRDLTRSSKEWLGNYAAIVAGDLDRYQLFGHNDRTAPGSRLLLQGVCSIKGDFEIRHF